MWCDAISRIDFSRMEEGMAFSLAGNKFMRSKMVIQESRESDKKDSLIRSEGLKLRKYISLRH